MKTSDVIVVGAGPTGLMLACELALAGVRCRVLDRRAGQSNMTRAFAVHARTLELLDARGLADELVPQGVPVRQLAPAARRDPRSDRVRHALSDGPHRAAERDRASVGGARAAARRSDRVRRRADRAAPGRRRRVRRRPQDGTVTTERAGYVVGCDGSHSAVRRARRHRLRRQAVSDPHPARRRPAHRTAGGGHVHAQQRARAWCSACRSATVGSGPSRGTGCGSRCRWPSR